MNPSDRSSLSQNTEYSSGAQRKHLQEQHQQQHHHQQHSLQQQKQHLWANARPPSVILQQAAATQAYSNQSHPSGSTSKAGPSSEGSSVSSPTTLSGLSSRYSHQPNVASPLRTAVGGHLHSPNSDESTPHGSPMTSNDTLQTDQLAAGTSSSWGTRPLDGMQRAKSNLEQSSRETSPSGSGTTTPTSYPPSATFQSAYESPSTSYKEHRRHSDTTDHLALHMTGSTSQWPGAETKTPMQRSNSRVSNVASRVDTDSRRGGELTGTGLLSSHYGLPNTAVTSAVGGYASSVDADFYSLPPSRLVSRTPTPVMNTSQAVVTPLTSNRPSSPDYTNSTATDSDGEESDYPSAPGWGGAREVASMFGFGGGKRQNYKRLSGKSYHAMEPRKSSRKWAEHTNTPSVESQRKFRSKESSKMYDAAIASGRSSGLLDQRQSRSHRRKKQSSSSSRLPWPFRVISSLLFKTFRTFFGPIHPLTIMVALALIAGFVTSVTMLIIYILNPDKEPLPWRTYCQQQMPFPHAYADALAPVNVLVGVVTTDSKYERRNIIRQTYARHTLPTDSNGNANTNVQVKFILGRVRKSHMRRVALEMEAFNDIVVLDMEETQSAHKTLRFFQWAAENATVPFLRPVESDWSNVDTVTPDPSLPGGLSDWHYESDDPNASTKQRYQLGWKKVDYVVKADDDSFIVLDELERHLRVAPRKMTYWGYLIKNWFMGGEAYALSFDLIEWMANSVDVARTAKGKEDTRTPQWIAMHPNRSSINWVSEHCWIYDHPKGQSPYSHGFLFPDYVEKIKVEARYGLSEQEITYRGGERASQAYSTVTKWHQRYVAPRGDLTMEEEVEALVEGGGRWAGTWVRSPQNKEGEKWIPYDDIVYGNNDGRLKPSVTNEKGSSVLAEDVGWEPSSGLYIYGSVESINSTSTIPSEVLTKKSATETKRDLLDDIVEIPNHLLGGEKVDSHSTVSIAPTSGETDQHETMGSKHYQPHLLPRPTHKDGNGEYATLRSQRYLNRPHGGTVVVHYLKKTEWWLETALALSGKTKMWNNGAGGKVKEWRMGGSPLIRMDGYILQGRSQPHPMAIGVAPALEKAISTTTSSEETHAKTAINKHAINSPILDKGSIRERKRTPFTFDNEVVVHAKKVLLAER